MALAVVSTHGPTLSWKRNLGNNSLLGKPRVSPAPSPISPTWSKRCNSLQTKALISSDNIVLSKEENGKYPEPWDHNPHNSFPPGFVFGAASAAFQVEGATKAGGRGPSIWDTFCENFPEKIADGSSGEPGAGSYYRYKEDVQLLADIGLKAYRFSISWSRVLPKGRGQPNREGINYYHKLIDELKNHGIEPYVTLFHWDVPQALEDEYGGFLSRRIIEDYKNYVKLCFDEFGPKVKNWITMNEPPIFCSLGYGFGTFAPGHCTPDLVVEGMDLLTCPVGDSLREPYKVAHNILLAHAEAVHLYKTEYKAKQKGKVGITLVTFWFEPFDNSPRNLEAQQRALDFNFGWFMDPLKFGEYPFSMRALVGDRLPVFTPEESLKLIDSYDFIGLNYYTARYVKDKPYNYTNKPKTNSDDPQVDIIVDRDGRPIGPAEPRSWVNVYPRGLKKLLLHIKKRYNNPAIYITENGVLEYNTDASTIATLPKPINGRLPAPIDDIFRTEYHTSHLHELEDALNSKANVKGYFVWSLLDSFEWKDGYTCQFGLNHINYDNLHEPDLRRIPKESARWLKRYLKNINDLQKSATVPIIKEEALEFVVATGNNP